MHFSKLELRIAAVGITVRIALYLAMMVAVGGEANAISGDADYLHYLASLNALDYAYGRTDWEKLIDDAWPVVIGMVYYYIYPSLNVIVVLNGLAAGLALVLLFRIVLMTTSNRLVAVAVGYTVALFPSAVFFQCLPIKESIAMLSIMSTTWGCCGCD